jgi:hypothetical protein
MTIDEALNVVKSRKDPLPSTIIALLKGQEVEELIEAPLTILRETADEIVRKRVLQLTLYYGIEAGRLMEREKRLNKQPCSEETRC